MMQRVVAALLAALIAVVPAQARWKVAESAHFRIWSEQDDNGIRKHAAMLEDYHRLLLFLTGTEWPKSAPRLDIYMVAGLPQMRIISPDLGDQVAGFYSASSGQIAAFSSRGGMDPTFARQVLLHEYTHHFMLFQSLSAMPAWYVEGFAEYLMTAEFRDDRVEWGEANGGRAYQLISNRPWIPMEQLLSRGRKVDMDAFYAQSWLLTHYMSRAPGMSEKLRAYLRKVGQGGNPVESFRTEVEPDLGKFQSQLRSYLNSRKITYSRMKREPPEQLPISFTTLPASADNMLLPLLSMQFPQRKETDERSLKRIRQEAAKFPGDPWAERAVAIAEAISGDPGAAAPLLDKALEAAPTDPVLLRWRASLYRPTDTSIPEADLKAARRLLVRSYKANPDDWLTLKDYVETLLVRNPRLSDSELQVLMTAYDLAPQVSQLAMMTGRALIEHGRYDDAWKVMAPTVFNPHNSGRSDRMMAFMAALKEGDAERVKALMKPALEDAADDEDE